jgi:NADH-quinone oxidoreductase subunit J
VVNISYIYYFFAAVSAILALVMLFSKNALVTALSLLGILICTAGIFAMMGEHFIAAIQLVVYAGAIMILFIFSIMLLNVKKEKGDFSLKSFSVPFGFLMVIIILAGGLWALYGHFQSPHMLIGKGNFDRETVKALGGNTSVLAHALFTQYYIPFEAISIPLLTALAGAVVLAKRKIG